jgi:endonuclease YncB( thermonuclease family)
MTPGTGMEKLIIRKQRIGILSAALLFISALALSACVYPRSKPDLATDAPEMTETAAVKESIFADIEGVECIPNLARYETATLVNVIDGDSIKVIVNGRETQVRYIGVNTPEYDSAQREEAIAATRENERLLAGSTLYLFKDISNTDQYDRLLRYVISNGQFINFELVRSGHAEPKTYRPDISCQLIFIGAAAGQ